MNATALWRGLLRQAPLVLLGLVFLGFGVMAPRFLHAANLVNIGVQAAPVGVVAIGMTFVLLTAGVDLSVGAIMFVTAAIAGKLLQGGWAPAPVFVVMLAGGAGGGAINALLIARYRVAAFIVTLALLFIGRGFALWLTQTRAMNLPADVLHWGALRFAGVPLPLLVFAGLAVVAHVVLTRTAFGRQVHAIGHNEEMARRAGVNTGRVLATVYLISGVAAAFGAMLSLGQLGAVTPKFGVNFEFKAIAAVVLGGTSLFGGRGAVLPGTVLGAVLMQGIENGEVLIGADPYAYPLVTSLVILGAIALDRLRTWLLQRGARRQIRREA